MVRNIYSGFTTLAIVFVLASASPVKADDVAAPLTAQAGQEIANNFISYYADDFKSDMAKVAKFPIPTADQSYVYAKYMNRAFKETGYSMDKTLLSYFKSERSANVILFMSKISLETYAIFLKNDDVGGAFLKAGAATQPTLDYAKDLAREMPIRNPDYVIPPQRDYEVTGLSKDLQRQSQTLLGYVRRGHGPWNNWLYLESFDRSGELKGIGLVDLRDIPAEEQRIWASLVDKKVKLEGTFFTAKGFSIGNPKDPVVVDPTYLDKAYKVVVKSL